MIAFLFAVRDALIVIALNWVGISVQAPEAPEPPTAEACGGDSSLCARAKPGFSSLDCPNI